MAAIENSKWSQFCKAFLSKSISFLSSCATKNIPANLNLNIYEYRYN